MTTPFARAHRTRRNIGLIVGAFFAMFSGVVLAEGTYQGPLVYVVVLGDGTIALELTSALTIGACSSAQVRIPPSNDAKRDILAVALAAYTTGNPVRVQADGCHGGYPTMTTTSSWIYMNP
jgi:hypothetical protein